MGETPLETLEGQAVDTDETIATRPLPPPEATPQTLDHSTTMGSSVGRYVVLETLGSGAMGTVLRAYDPKLHREVALKQLRSRALGEQAEARLVQEAQALAQLSHPNVVAVYDVEPEANQVIVAMELVRGSTLRQWLMTSHPWRRCVALMIEAGQGLAAAHQAGLVHRDFKPANVMITPEGQAKVMDFGLAKPANADSTLHTDSGIERSGDEHPRFVSVELPAVVTEANIVLGTPAYMAPEQHTGATTEPAVDQYAFCVTLWEALVGARPFGGTVSALFEHKCEGPPPWPRSVSVPRRLVAAIQRGLAPDPQDRWPAMAALLEELSAVQRPRRSRLGSLAVAAVLGGSVASVVAVQSDRAAPCVGAREHLQGLWDESTRDTVHQSISALDPSDEVWTRVSAQLDDYADAWVSGHQQACEATAVHAEQSTAVLDLRMACLHRARAQLRVDVELLSALDERTLPRAVDLVTTLPSLERCADVDALLAEVPPPEDPAIRAAVDEARARLAEADSLQDLGRYDDAEAAVRGLEADASALGYAPLETERLALEGRVQEALGQFERSEQTLRRATLLAIEQGTLLVAVEALATWIFVLDVRLDRQPEAYFAAQLGLRLARRVGSSSLVAQMLNRMGSVLENRGEWDDAESRYREALSTLEAATILDETELALTLNDLGIFLSRRGQIEEALQVHLRALEIRERVLGPQHPYVGSTLLNLGVDHFRAGAAEDARRMYERAMDIYTRAYGPDHPVTNTVRGNLGGLAVDSGELDRAAELLARVLEGNIRHYGSEHIETADSYNNLGALELQRKNHDRALEYLQHAHQILLDSLGTEHPRIRTARHNLGIVEFERGDHARAIEHFEHALAASKYSPPEATAQTEFELAQLLWEDPATRERARALAEGALARFKGAENVESQAAECEAWLDEHPLDAN